MASNSEGARPKTSSKSEKSKQETDVKKQLLTVLIMNAHGDNQGKGTAERRKNTILNVIKRNNPYLVLFQEFAWIRIHGKAWSSDAFPEHYQITGSSDASIMYNINELTVEESPIGELQRILKELQRPTMLPSLIPLEFTPISRMALRVVKTKGVPNMEFVSISWHGRHKNRSNEEKVTEFQYLMIFLNKIYVKSQLPILIAGDFNVKMELICHKVKDPFKLYEYEASERRKKKGVIDYFIATTELHLSDMTPVDLKKDSDADKPEEVLDHDPIIAMLEPAPLTVPALKKATVKISKKAK